MDHEWTKLNKFLFELKMESSSHIFYATDSRLIQPILSPLVLMYGIPNYVKVLSSFLSIGTMSIRVRI